jgi:transcription elongation factor Elf1
VHSSGRLSIWHCGSSLVVSCVLDFGCKKKVASNGFCVLNLEIESNIRSYMYCKIVFLWK